jgi:hypothetical protein
MNATGSGEVCGLAEADGNRTHQAEILGLTGVEDRAAHQDEYASAPTISASGSASDRADLDAMCVSRTGIRL